MAFDKSSRSNHQSDDEIFNSLTESAFDFLERAVGEFRGTPKFSTIHFATAVELFLKARLMREHWSLVIDDADKTSKAQFLEGRARTITPFAAISRLRNLVGVSISPEAEKAFLAISEHRNKMIHFVHEDEKPKNKDGELFEKSTLERVAIEQCRGWLQLERLLAEWADHFRPWENRIEKIRASMKGHQKFLGAVFERVSPELVKLEKAGIVIQDCESCSFFATKTAPITANLSDLDCLVCGAKDTQIMVSCPNEECEDDVYLNSSSGHSKCKKCKTEIGAEELSNALDTDTREYYDRTDKNCAWCSGYHTVVQHGDYYVCCECLQIGTDYGVCGWCNEGQLGGGDLEGSHYTGCEFCDGLRGWHGDDD